MYSIMCPIDLSFDNFNNYSGKLQFVIENEYVENKGNQRQKIVKI